VNDMPNDGESRPEPVQPGLSRSEKAVGVFALAAWCVVFNIGNSIGARPLITALNDGTTRPIVWLANFFAIAFVYTPTNVLVLSFAAGLAGTIFGRLEIPVPNSGELAAKPGDRWWKAMLGSFMVYLVVLSGVLAIVGAPFKLPEIAKIEDVEKAQVNYRVTASFCSLFSLIEGSRPFILASIAGRIQRLLTPQSTAGSNG
jgi:hypothetical protein